MLFPSSPGRVVPPPPHYSVACSSLCRVKGARGTEILYRNHDFILVLKYFVASRFNKNYDHDQQFGSISERIQEKIDNKSILFMCRKAIFYILKSSISILF